MAPVSLITCLKKSIFFGTLPDEVLDRIASAAKVGTYDQGDMICRQGDVANALYCVSEGTVKLSVMVRNGQEVVVEIFQPGASFAEALLFRDAVYPVSAVALTDAKVISVRKSVVEAELRAHPDTIPTVLAATFSHLHALVRQIEALKASSGLQRVAGYILAMHDHEADADAIRIPFEKQTLASLLGITPETLSRAFRRLSEHGVRVAGPVVMVHDRRALEAFLEET